MATVANNAGPTAPWRGAYLSDLNKLLGIYDESGVGENRSAADDFDALPAGVRMEETIRGRRATAVASIPHPR